MCVCVCVCVSPVCVCVCVFCFVFNDGCTLAMALFEVRYIFVIIYGEVEFKILINNVCGARAR